MSLAAPTKAHRNYAALRQGRDPRMNEANAHFDEEQARLDKENQGFNMGRKKGQRPSSAIIRWRPTTPFLTFEKHPLNDAEKLEYLNKTLHAKVMNDRV